MSLPRTIRIALLFAPLLAFPFRHDKVAISREAEE
jgi:hypothetical protein